MPSFYSIGFFGAPNLGDELLATTVVAQLKRGWPQCQVSVMTRSEASSTGYAPMDVSWIEGWAPRPEYLRHLGQHLRAAGSDLTLIGGGGLISDHYAWQGAICYFTDVCWGLLRGRRFVFVGLGVVGLRRFWLRPLVRFVGRHAAAVYLRDETSAQRFRSLTGRDRVTVGPDLACLSQWPSGAAPTDQPPYALVNVRQNPPLNEDGLRALIGVLVEDIGRVVLLSAEPSDEPYYQHILAGLSEDIASRVEQPGMETLLEAMARIEGASVVVSERLHVNVVAARMQKRMLVLEYESKVRNFMASVTGGGYLTCTLDEISAERARELLALPNPDWSESLERLAAQAQTAFTQTVATGLAAPGPGALVRLTAALHLAWLLPLCVVYGGLILIKRLFFGRGPIRKKRVTT